MSKILNKLKNTSTSQQKTVKINNFTAHSSSNCERFHGNESRVSNINLRTFLNCIEQGMMFPSDCIEMTELWGKNCVLKHFLYFRNANIGPPIWSWQGL